MKVGWEHVMLKLPFVFIPVVLFMSADYLENKSDKILMSFVAGNFIASVVCIIAAMVRSLSYVNGSWEFHAELMEHTGYTFWQMLANGGNNFMYEPLSIFIHPGYFSVFNVVSVLILLELLFQKKIGDSVKARILFVILIFFFCIMVYLLFARTGLIALFVVLLGYLLLLTFRGKGRLYKAGALLLFVLGSLYVLTHNGRMINSYNEIKKVFSEPGSISKQDDRIFIWGISFNIIKNNLWAGVGTGDGREKLMEVYRKNNMIDAQKQQLNVHNQFLETTMQLGLPGLFCLLAIFIWPLVLALRNRNISLLLLQTVNILFFFFESGLNTQAGVFYFVLLLSVLMFLRPLKKNVIPSVP